MKVGLDVDGILADFYLHMCKYFNKPYVFLHSWDVDWIDKCFNEIADDKMFWLTIPTLNPPEAITFDFDYYITAIPKHLKQFRQQWLKHNGFPDKPVIVSNDKLYDCMKLGVRVLIDDSPNNLRPFIRYSDLYTIQYKPSYFKSIPLTGNYTIRHLSEVNQIIEDLKLIESKDESK